MKAIAARNYTSHSDVAAYGVAAYGVAAYGVEAYDSEYEMEYLDLENTGDHLEFDDSPWHQIANELDSLSSRAFDPVCF